VSNIPFAAKPTPTDTPRVSYHNNPSRKPIFNAQPTNVTKIAVAHETTCVVN